MLHFVSHKKRGGGGGCVGFWTEPKTTPVHEHILVCVCLCVSVHMCELARGKRMHTSMPECVILVFSHRQRPKPSYKS